MACPRPAVLLCFVRQCYPQFKYFPKEEDYMQYDLIIRHARLHRHDGFVDIAVKDGRYAKIAGELSSRSAQREIDAAGRLVVPPFIDAHRSEERRVGKECRSRW